jgi:hypothetical protein
VTGTDAVFLGYAYLSSTTAQAGIQSGNVVNLNNMNANSPAGAFLQSGGGVQVTAAGTYQIYYQVMPNQIGSAVLFSSVTSAAIAGSAFGNASSNTLISGNVIVPLSAGEVVTIVNNSASQTYTTVPTGSSTVPVAAVEMVIVRIQ